MFQNHKKKVDGRETTLFFKGGMCQRSAVFEGRRLLRDALGADEACVFVRKRARLCKQKKSLNADAVFGVIVKSEDECSINRGFRSRAPPPQSSHLFLQRFLPGGGHLRRWHALTGASFQQVNPGWARALLVLKVEEHILVKREELLVPAAVLRRLLAQEAAPGALFTRDHRQEQRVPFVVTDALLHFAVGSERKWANLVGGGTGVFTTRTWWPVAAFQTFPPGDARKSCPADGSASAEELMAKGSDFHARYHKETMLTNEHTPVGKVLNRQVQPRGASVSEEKLRQGRKQSRSTIIGFDIG